MGSGKTTYFIEQINQNPEKNYIYITPYLDEIERIKQNTDVDIYDPINSGDGKLSSLNNLLSMGKNIVATHALFSTITTETKHLIQQGRYTLILDEVMEVVSIYKGKKKGELKKGDLNLLLKDKVITIDDSGFVHLNPDNTITETLYDEFLTLVGNNSIVYVNNKLLLWHFPADVFDLFNEVFVLTYLFNGTILKSYFDYHGIKYIKKQVVTINGKYTLVDYDISNEVEIKKLIKKKINICHNKKLNDIGIKCNALSATWHESAKKQKEPLKLLKNNTYNYFRNHLKAKANTIMWTSLKETRNLITGSGYTNAISRNQIPKDASEREKNKALCFVPCNCRATNDYADRYNLAYLINRYINPFVKDFFATKDIKFDEDTYALSELLQWIWRSRIRNSESINLYIPSSRMRNLLINWLETEVNSSKSAC